MTTYDDLRQPVTDRLRADAVFLCGERCAAEVSLRTHQVGRVAMSPLDVLTGLRLEVAEIAEPEVSVFPGHLEKLHRLTPTATARSRWFGLPRDPGFVVSFTLRNDGDTAYRFELTGLMDVNVNYVSKFRVIPNDTVEVVDDLVVVRDGDHPDLVAALAASETWDDLVIEAGAFGPAGGAGAARRPRRRALSRHRRAGPRGQWQRSCRRG